MKQVDLCICETGCGLVLAQAKALVVFPNDEIILEDGRRAVVISTLSVEKGDETFAFIYKLSKQTLLPKVDKVVRYEEVR